MVLYMFSGMWQPIGRRIVDVAQGAVVAPGYRKRMEDAIAENGTGRAQVGPGATTSNGKNRTLLMMYTVKEDTTMYQMAQPVSPQAGGPMSSSDEVAAMQASFRALRLVKPQPIDLATWYARVKVNSDSGTMSAPPRVLAAA